MPPARDRPTAARPRRRLFPSSLFALVVPLVMAGLLGSCGEPAEGLSETAAEWEELAPVPEARTEISVATDGERIYLAGGFLAPPEGRDPGDERPPAARRLLVYDPAEDAWSEEGKVPVGTHHAGLLGVGGRLYLVGGYAGNSFEPRSGTVWIYDPSSAEWSQGSPMPTPRGGLAYAVHEDHIHTIGGTVSDPDALDPAERTVSDEDASVGTHEIYHPESDSWERLGPHAHAPEPPRRGGGGRQDLGHRRPGGREYHDDGDRGLRPGDGLLVGGRAAPHRSERGGPGRPGRPLLRLRRRDLRPGRLTHLRRGGALRPLDGRVGGAPAHAGDPRHGVGAAALDGAVYVVSGGPEPGFHSGTANERLTP